ncbi:MAG: DNA polymerase domain-containing protein [Candidatus Hodarchaeota archaeon]
MKEFTGWVLDVGTRGKHVTLWIKLRDGRAIEVNVPYKPTLYLVPKQDDFGSYASARGYVSSLENLEGVDSVSIVPRRVRVRDVHDTPVIQVKARDPRSFRELVPRLTALDHFELFNADIPLFQKYLYETGLFPFSKARFKASVRNSSLFLEGFELLDDRRRLVYDLPPLRPVWLEVVPQASSTVSRMRVDNPIRKVSLLQYDESYARRKPKKPVVEPFELERGQGVDEAELIKALVRQVREADPDIILTRGGDERVFPYLCARASLLGLERFLKLSRTSRPLVHECFRVNNEGDGSFFSYGRIMRCSKTQYYLSGRLHLDTSVYGSLHFKDGNLPGLIEVGRISSVPLQRLNRITIGGALQSIQFQIAHDWGILIPQVKRSAESFKSSANLLLADRGGHIFEPATGVFDNAISLDFTSMYPMIMSEYNVSPETINCDCCASSGKMVPGLDYHVCNRRGLVSEAIGLPLYKRIKYKYMARKAGEYGERFELMQAALKWILVVSFGYLGFKNARFGRIEAHQSVCAYSREMLLRAARIVREHGFEVIHGIVDSLWAQKKGGHDGKEDLEAISRKLCDEIHRETGLPIESDGVFKFVVFLPSVVNRNIGTLNHYWGVFKSGKVKVRGIELRRHDSPGIVKAMQKEVIAALAPARDKGEFMTRMPDARAVLGKYISAVESGNYDPGWLVVTTRVSKEPGEYKVNNYQAVAAKQLQKRGVSIKAGQKVEFIITNASSTRASDRVVAWDLFEERNAKPDVAKYKELLERAFGNMFPFEVDLGDGGKPRSPATCTLDKWVKGYH